MLKGLDTASANVSAAKSNQPSVAVAFGCGGARGLAHVHVIEALDELGIRPVAIAGSSIGAIIGAGMAAGMSGAQIRDHALATVGNKGAVANRLWSLRPATMRDVMSGIRIGQFNLERILKAFMPSEIPEEFAGLRTPLKVVTTDYYRQSEVVLETGDLYHALAASAAMPAVFMPVRVDGKVMFDGGIINPVPYEHLLDIADIVIAVDAVGGPEGDGIHIPNRMESIFGAGQLLMQASISLKLRISAPHIFLRPTLGRTGVMDFLKAKEILAMSQAVKDELKYALDREMELRG